MSDNKKLLKEIVSDLVAKLKAEGFTIQYYEAMSTNSIYVKMDYGACNSVRISDHKGYKHLQYRFNLILGCEKPYEADSPQGWPRYFYPARRVVTLVKAIKRHREICIQRSGGTDSYKRKMEISKANNKNKAGFWSRSIEV